MRIKRRNVARLASLSALGAGALGVAVGTAQASDIVFMPLPTGTVVGPGGLRYRAVSASLTLPGSTPSMSPWTTHFGLSLSRAGRSHPRWGTWAINLWATGLQFRTHGNFLSIVGPGKKWSNVTGPGTVTNSARIASRSFSIHRYWSSGTWFNGTFVPPRFSSNGNVTGGSYYINSGWRNSHWVTTTSSNASGNGAFTDQYALFVFQNSGANYLYGWVELSNAVSEYPGSGPDVTLVAWAYDSTPGEQIAAGDTGAAPEPSTLALTGLAALALGATGLRRWRAARKPVA